MRPLNWQITKFNGIHSYPSDIPEGSAVFTQDMVNLRIDRWGHLRPRPPIRRLPTARTAGTRVTGVDSSAGYVYYLRDDGKLFQDSIVSTTLMEVLDVENLEGRLSIVSTFDEFVILTSEGNDQGYYHRLGFTRALPLGLPKPDIDNFRIKVGIGSGIDPNDDEEEGNEFTENHLFYKIAFAADGDGGFVSEPTDALSVAVRQLPRGDSFVAKITALSYAFDNLDPRITHINTYRSQELHPEGTDDDDISYYRLESARIDTLPEDPLAILNPFIVYTDETDHSGLQEDVPRFTDFPSLYPLQDNSAMSEGITQIAYYNGRLFGTEFNTLRFTDVRFGIPIWGIWPLEYSRIFNHSVRACTEYRGFLIVGGPEGLYAMSGDSPFNFNISRLSSRGPVSAHAWGIVNDLFYFVAIDGIYISDGATVQPIAPELKGYFNRYQIEDGLVAQLINNVTLIGVTRRDADDNIDTLQFVNDRGKWTRLDTDRIHQTTTLPLTIEHARKETTVIADSQDAPGILTWIVEDTGIDNDDDDEPIAWSWDSQALAWDEQGIGERMKNFKWLEISGLADPPEITCTFYIDDKDPMTVTKTLDRELTDKFRPLKVRINRWGYGLRFSIEGAGDITLRGLRLNIQT